MFPLLYAIFFSLSSILYYYYYYYYYQVIFGVLTFFQSIIIYYISIIIYYIFQYICDKGRINYGAVQLSRFTTWKRHQRETDRSVQRMAATGRTAARPSATRDRTVAQCIVDDRRH